MGNLVIHLFEHEMEQNIILPRDGEKWFKNHQFEGNTQEPFIKKSISNPNWLRGMPNTCLKHHWDELTFLV